MKFLKKSLLVALVLLIALIPVASAHAARISQLSVENKGDFVLEPGKIEVFVNPGETVTRNISVINRVNRKVDFKIETEDFIGSDNPNTPVILLGNDKSPYSFKDNLIPEEDAFSLEFGQKIELPIRIQIPADAQPGGFYSSVIVSSMPSSDSENLQTGARIISRVGVLMFIRVNGPVEQSGDVTDFRIGGGEGSFMQSGPVPFEILFKNAGSVHLVPYGEIAIRNILGKQVAKIPVDAYFSLPKSTRYRQVIWEQAKLFGRYTATLTMNDGYEGKQDTKKVVFWVVPWEFIAITLAVIFLLSFLVYFIKSRFEFKRKDKDVV
jgi:hypothetical protein